MPALLDTHDLAAAEVFLSDTYGEVHLHTDEARPVARIVHAVGGGLSVARVDLTSDITYEMEPTGLLLLGAATRWHPGRTGDLRAASSAVGIIAEPDASCRGRQHPLRADVVGLHPRLLRDAMASRARHARAPASEPTRLGAHPVDAASAAMLSGVIRDVVHHVLTVDTARFPLPLSSATQQLATAVLATFAGHGRTEATSRDRRDATSLTLGSAKTFIEEHAAEAITLTQIAAAAHVTARSVQYAFADVGSTPLAYLRRVRLEHAHAELQAGGRDGGTTVTEIALSWGFSHQGRFAAAYRDRYGVRPGATLRG